MNERVTLYRLLSQALAYPDRNFIARLQTTIGSLNLEALGDQRLPLTAFMQELGNLSTLPLDQVQGEYTRLFINDFPHVTCPPYESVYQEGVLLGQAADEADRLYRHWGLTVDGEQVDHVGAELEFMAFLLTLNTVQSLAAADRFLGEHILLWLPRFADDVMQHSRLKFYEAVGRLLSAVLCQLFSPVV